MPTIDVVDVLKALKQKRSSFKGSQTKFHTFISSKDQFTEVENEELRIRLSKLIEQFKSFSEVQDQIEQIEPAQAVERDDVESTHFRLLAQANTHLKKVENHERPVGGCSVSETQIRDEIAVLSQFVARGNEANVSELEYRIRSLESLWGQFVGGSLSKQTKQEIQLEFFSVMGRAHDIIKANAPGSTAPPVRPADIMGSLDTVKLPTIKLPSFDGDYSGWLYFYDTFHSLIHQHASLTEIEKFHYLRSSLTGDAAAVIRSLEMTSQNYQVAWNLIVERFKNQRLIVFNHIRAIFELPSVARDSHVGLREFLNSYQKHMRALKALGQPIEEWDTPIVYLLSTKLDLTTRREWESRNTSKEVPSLAKMIECLTNRCNVLEALNCERGRAPVAVAGPRPTVGRHVYSHHAASGDAAFVPPCPKCRQAHYLFSCPEFRDANVRGRIDMVERLGVCRNCLRSGHHARDCRSTYDCRHCGSRHHSMVHAASAGGRDSARHNQNHNNPGTSGSAVIPSLVNFARNSAQVLLATARVRVFDGRGNYHEARCLLDSGSQINFINTNLVNRLGLEKRKTNTVITGISAIASSVEHETEIELESMIGRYRVFASCVILPRITEQIPAITFDPYILELPNVELADPFFNVSEEIDLLLGAPVFFEIIKANHINLGRGKPILRDTKFGWILAGDCPLSARNVPARVSLAVTGRGTQSIQDQLAQFWEIEERASTDCRSTEERECEKHFLRTYERSSEGRFVVRLPFRDDNSLGESHEAAIRRFSGLERKFARDKTFHDTYSNFMSEYLMLDHMERVDDNDRAEKNKYYLPHHAVIREASLSTKLLVVFDASAKSSNGKSLNDLLMVGPTIQPDLFSIVLRFRTHKFVLTADITKMYRQILVAECDRDYQRIVWRDNVDQPIKSYRLKTVTYGTAAAPFLAIKSLCQLAEDESEFSLAKPVIQNDFYVDDMLTGADSVLDLRAIQDEVVSCLARGGFSLDKWASNHPELVQEAQTEVHVLDLNKNSATKTLGLLWHHTRDVLKYDIDQIQERHELVTKRSMLSLISRLFDPLGLVAPIFIRAKMFLQTLWRLQSGWDEPVPAEILANWSQFVADLRTLTGVEIPRYVVGSPRGLGFEVHGFCDASQNAYGACMYVRVRNENGHYVTRLLCAKSRVAPLKTISIPRLELCGAVVLVRLAAKVKAALGNFIKSYTFWTDSTIVLAWLAASPSDWKVFVANRVSEIQTTLSGATWKHVGTAENPADLISRGASPDQLRESSIWWSGPEFLKLESSLWPLSAGIAGGPVVDGERRGAGVAMIVAAKENEILNALLKHSSYLKIRRVTAWCLRFIGNCRAKKGSRVAQSTLSCGELDRSGTVVIGMSQRHHFSDEFEALKSGTQVGKKSKLLSLNPFVGRSGLLRVGGRLARSEVECDVKHQIILPRADTLSNLIIKYEHERQLHAGNSATLAALRQKYWPIGGRNAVRFIIHRCIRCFRAKPVAVREIMGQLPSHRTQISGPFLTTGIDYAGPVMAKEGRGRGKRSKKANIALFVCFVTKAVHIELVSDLTAESFLGALKRFISRRGQVAHIYCDNATNFRGASNELRDVYRFLKSQSFSDHVMEYMTHNNISWHFIPPRAPNFGGLWEAGVKSIKNHLKRVIGLASLTFEEMNTVLVRIEACLNSRPLTPLSDDPDNLDALTPGHFLIGVSFSSMVDPDWVEVPTTRLSRWQHVEKLRQHFWRRWSTEYLPTLQRLTKWRTKKGVDTIQLNTMVLVHEENQPPLVWKLGRIVDVHPGVDGVVRVVSVKTSTGVMKRSISKISPLPIEANEPLT